VCVWWCADSSFSDTQPTQSVAQATDCTPTNQPIDQQAMDKNTDGLIEFSEWAAWWAERRKK